MKRLPASESTTTQRSKKQRHVSSIKVPPGAELCYCFPDGASFAGVIKLVMLCRDDSNFQFTREKISCVRSNGTRSILVDVEWKHEKLLLHGKTEDIPESGFTFGVNLKEFHTMATRTLTKNDMFLIYFKADNSVMYVEQISYKTTSDSRNETPFQNKHVPAKAFTTRIIGQRGQPNVIVKAEEFFLQANLLYVAKYHRIVIHCSKEGVQMSGENKDGVLQKTITFRSRLDNVTDDVSVAITHKKFKTLIQMRNIARNDSSIRVFFQNSLPILFICDIGPPDDCYGHFKLFLREEKTQTTQE